ncbi:MAG TPA: calcium-binding protein [Rhizomicrobium sp.]|nr:calcium-binding protein [Rhizomicrobium sp.]
MATTIEAGAVGQQTLSFSDNYTLESTGSITDESSTAMLLNSGECVISVFGGIYGQNGIAESNTGTGASTVYVGASGIVSGLIDYGIVLFDDQNFVTNDGTVQGAIHGIELEGDQEMVANNGRVSGGYWAIVLAGAQGAVTNTGTITGGDGVEFGGGSTATTDRLENTGTIMGNDSNPESNPDRSSSYGVADENHSGNFVADNSGTIAGDRGIVFEGASGLVDSLTNSGTIDGRGVYAVEEEGGAPAGGAALQVVNSGIISSAQAAIGFGAESAGNTLDNSGTIIGNIVSDSTSTLAIANSGHIAGNIDFGGGDDSYDGTLGDITGWIRGGGGEDTLTGGAGNDRFDMASNFDAGDRIDGGAGRNTLSLDGDYYSTGLVLGADTLTNVERIVLADGFGYRITTDDANVAAGATLTVDASALTGVNLLNFNGSNETDGRFDLIGGGGNDVLRGGAGNDVLSGNGGANWFTGGLGADRISSPGAHDRFIYTDVSESTSTTHDIITGFAANTERFDLDVTVTGVNGAMHSGMLRAKAFDADLTTAVDAAHLAAGHAVLFTPSSGNLAGHTYLIVDANGVAGYQAGQDYVMEIVSGTHLTSLSAATFI